MNGNNCAAKIINLSFCRTLTNTTTRDLHSLHNSLSALHRKYGVPNVVISSMPLRDFLRDTLPDSTLPPTSSNRQHHTSHLHLFIYQSFHESSIYKRDPEISSRTLDSTCSRSPVYTRILLRRRRPLFLTCFSAFSPFPRNEYEHTSNYPSKPTGTKKSP